LRRYAQRPRFLSSSHLSWSSSGAKGSSNNSGGNLSQAGQMGFLRDYRLAGAKVGTSGHEYKQQSTE
jgi:hypothetical protein